MEIAIQVLLGLSVIGFGVLLWKSSERWTWVPLVVAPIVLLLAGSVVVLLAQSLKARAAWQKVNVDLEKKLVQLTAEKETLQYGDPVKGTIAVSELKLELKTTSIDTGRVWRGLGTVGRNGNQFNLSMPVDPNAPADDAAVSQTIPTNLTVYAFSEIKDQEGNLLPSFFLGEFKVTQANDQQVTIEPLLPLNAFTPMQNRAIGNAQTPTWALYELMPVDSHEAFKTEGSKAREDEIFGHMDMDFLDATFAVDRQTQLIQPRLSPEDQQSFLNDRQAILDSYKRDGSQATSADPTGVRWIKIEFIKDYTDTVDSRQQRPALEGNYFDLLGQAVDSRLQLVETDTVTLKKGTQIVLQYDAAMERINAGDAKQIDFVFVRPLNDYEEHSRHVKEQLAILKERSEVLKREKAQMLAVQATTTQMVIAAQNDFTKLESDVKQTRVEKNAIATHAAELKRRKTEMRKRLAAIYTQNLNTVRKLEYAQKVLKDQIDARTAAAAR